MQERIKKNMIYYINGFREGKSYFLSFGFTEEELNKMMQGDIITKNNNSFWIVKKDL